MKSNDFDLGTKRTKSVFGSFQYSEAVRKRMEFFMKCDHCTCCNPYAPYVCLHSIWDEEQDNYIPTPECPWERLKEIYASCPELGE